MLNRLPTSILNPSPFSPAPWLLLSASLLVSTSLWASTPKLNATRANDEIAVIESDADCVQDKGIPISEVPDDQVKLACLMDTNVRYNCNQDGQHARMEAFRQWESQLMAFQANCTQNGGTFTFAMDSFKEPANESFCTPAEPEISYNSFEKPLCNFSSHCPQVQVVCRHQEEADSLNAQHTVLLPGIPKPVAITY
jgi:hypothetical protein